MSSKGQVTIPASIRDALDLKVGDLIDFYFDESSRSVRLRARNRSSTDLFGALNSFLPSDRPVLSPKEIDDAVAAGLAEDDARIMREHREWREFLAWRRSRSAEAAE
jgi:AbrB family looped-hinge helix DNA binding protein